jgi:hypothetical protein
MANREKFGKASTTNGTRIRHHRLVDGNNHFRIAPAYGTLAASGKWFRFIKQHWGYKSAGNDTSPAGFPKLFICPEDVDYKSKMIRKACDECSLISNTAAKVENREAQLKEGGKSEAEIETILGAQYEWLKAHNLDKKYIVLAKNDKNEWGVLWLPYKAKEALDTRRKLVQAEEGFDVLDAEEGAWVNFTRSGQGFKTNYGCDSVSEIITLDNGKKAKQPKQEALVDADFDAIVAECPDLNSVGTVLTDEQISRLVESMGDADVVEAIFNEGREASPAPVAKAEPKMAPRPVAKVVAVNTTAAEASVTNTPSITTAINTSVPAEEDDEEAALAAQLAALKAKKAAKALVAQVEAAPKVSPAAIVAAASMLSAGIDPDSMSDDEFVKAYGNKS